MTNHWQLGPQVLLLVCAMISVNMLNEHDKQFKNITISPLSECQLLFRKINCISGQYLQGILTHWCHMDFDFYKINQSI